MNVLIDEYPLVVLPTLACQYGLNEAIVIQQIHYWTQKNKPMSDGYSWVYNSIPEWKKQFPFWSERTIFTILKKLKLEGMIFAECKSDNHWDKTLYYRLNYEKFTSSMSQPLRDRSRKNCDITINTDITRYNDHFDDFWKSYPRKTNKENARKVWARIKPNAELVAIMKKAIKDQKLSETEQRFICHASTWLTNKRWEDEIAKPFSLPLMGWK